MLLNQTIEYGFRAAACLAIHFADGPVSSAQLSERTSIPIGYLSKIMRRLVVSGIVNAQRGHGGGFHLARPPSEIRFMEILEALDFVVEQKRCAFGFGQCDHTSPCPLHNSWGELRAQFLNWACTQTLGDLTDGNCAPSFSMSAAQMPVETCRT